MDADRDRRLRRRFGPPASEPASARPAGRRPASVRLLAIAAPLVLLLALGGAAIALTPRDHVAAGCLWWTAAEVGRVVPGDRGCLRGYVGPGGELAEGMAAGDPRLAIAYSDPDVSGGRAACRFRVGDAVVVRYHAVFDDGRTIAVIEDCR